MLARGAKSVYVCLRCQKNLVTNNLNPSGAIDPLHGRVIRRWQNTATRQVALEESDFYSDSKNNLSENNQQSQQENRARPDGKPRHFRKWRPQPTAELGVNSLGKPAEVLLLPSRDRWIPQVPKGDGRGKVGTTLQESIDSEKVPLNGQKLAENIEQIRSLIGKMRGQLEKHEWITLKKHLRSGFQTLQLKNYVRLRKGDLSSLGLPKKFNKNDIIRCLVEEVWGFTTPVRDESSATPGKTGKKIKMSYNLQDPAKLEHLMTHPTQPLNRIAAEYDVQIDVYPSQSRIRTWGFKNDANQALQKIVRYAKDLGLIIIQLKGPLGPIYQDHNSKDYLHAYLKSLQRKYQGLNIAWNKDHITIVHLNNHRAADQARREILLSAPAMGQKSVVWPQMDDSETMLQPFPTPSEFPVALHRSQWLRLVSSSATPQTSHSGSRSATPFTSILQSLRDAFKTSATIRHTNNRQNLYYDVTASFGQALVQDLPQPIANDDDKNSVNRSEEEFGEFDDQALLDTIEHKHKAGMSDDLVEPKTNAPEEGFEADDDPELAQIIARKAVIRNESVEPETKSSSPAKTESSAKAPSDTQDAANEGQPKEWSESSTRTAAPERRLFVGGAPFLAQHFALMDSWIQPLSEPSKDVDENACAILRLELSPVSTMDVSPTFEIFVTAGESTDDQKPRLNIVKVSAIHQANQFTVLCPQNQVDVNFIQQLKQDVAYPGSSKPGVALSLMNAFRAYVGRAQSHGSSDWVFMPFVILPIHHTFRDVLESVEQAASKRKPGRPKEEPGSPDKKLEYILRTVDVVDVDSRLFSIQSASTTSKKKPIPTRTPVSRNDFCLDHIIYNGADATKQQLRLAASSVLYPPALTQPHMPTFVKAALKLAERLSENPLKPRRRHETSLAATEGDTEDAETKLGPRDQPYFNKKVSKKAEQAQEKGPRNQKRARGSSRKASPKPKAASGKKASNPRP